MGDDRSIGHAVAVKEDRFVNDKKRHQSDDQKGNGLLGIILESEFYHASKVGTFLIYAIPKNGDFGNYFTVY